MAYVDELVTDQIQHKINANGQIEEVLLVLREDAEAIINKLQGKFEHMIDVAEYRFWELKSLHDELLEKDRKIQALEKELEVAQQDNALLRKTIQSTHKNRVKHENCQIEHCHICDGGLFQCADCHLAEIECEEVVCTKKIDDSTYWKAQYEEAVKKQLDFRRMLSDLYDAATDSNNAYHRYGPENIKYVIGIINDLYKTIENDKSLDKKRAGAVSDLREQFCELHKHILKDYNVNIAYYAQFWAMKKILEQEL